MKTRKIMKTYKHTPKPWNHENILTILQRGSYSDHSDDEGNARLMAASPEFKELVERAIDVLQRQIVPDGLSDQDALSELHEIFDGPQCRDAFKNLEIK